MHAPAARAWDRGPRALPHARKSAHAARLDGQGGRGRQRQAVQIQRNGHLRVRRREGLRGRRHRGSDHLARRQDQGRGPDDAHRRHRGRHRGDEEVRREAHRRRDVDRRRRLQGPGALRVQDAHDDGYELDLCGQEQPGGALHGGRPGRRPRVVHRPARRPQRRGAHGRHQRHRRRGRLDRARRRRGLLHRSRPGEGLPLHPEVAVHQLRRGHVLDEGQVLSGAGRDDCLSK
mmetsp:Transcript_2028/g.6137  ORF Transcript_2028/g.6137 Transcript_2028/m.6137 type:complete len:232 (+) Transcript_2028:975-1670(+)